MQNVRRRTRLIPCLIVVVVVFAASWMASLSPDKAPKSPLPAQFAQTSKSQVAPVAPQVADFSATKAAYQSNNPAAPAMELPVDVAALSAEEREILRNLPPICTGEIPELGRTADQAIPDHSNFAPPQGFQQKNIPEPPADSKTAPKSQTTFDPNVVQASFDDFGYPSKQNQQEARYERNHGSPAPQSSSHQPVDSSIWAAEGVGNTTLVNPHRTASAHGAAPKSPANGDVDPHLEVYSKSAFPSAMECAECHQQIYDEWASSSHAYAAVSPMFHSFEDKINALAQGTIGYFCMRCHAPVATTMGLRRDQTIWDGPRVFKEGVTCVVCHRVKTAYTKSNGERRIEPGDIYAPVYGAGSGEGVDVVRKYKQHFKVKTDPTEKLPGQPIHRRAIQFDELSKSTFCMPCHQVAVQPGIKLEVVWDQFRASPAYKEGVTCQDCHMGRVPGVDGGYSVGPAAVVNGKVVNPERRHSNHLFFGPGYSIAHPGIFPFTKEAERWSENDWLEFDWRAGWGTDQFEDALAEGKFSYSFPKVWDDVDDRYDAREIIDANLKKLAYKKDVRRQLMENGSKLDGPFFTSDLTSGKKLTFNYCVTNLNPGHNMPSGSLGAQPQLWLNVVLIDPNGYRVWETGYLDSNGDLADRHSLDVLARRVPLDTQLVNFQTRFLTTNVKGTDREMYLPVNVDFDQLPFLRPAAQPVSVINHPPFIRMESHSLAPLGSRTAKFSIPARLMQQPGTYRLTARMRSRAEPIYFMRFCDATPEMERMMNEWIADFHVQSVAFEVR